MSSEPLTLAVIRKVHDNLAPTGDFTEHECSVIRQFLTILIDELERAHGSQSPTPPKVSAKSRKVSGN